MGGQRVVTIIVFKKILAKSAIIWILGVAQSKIIDAMSGHEEFII